MTARRFLTATAGVAVLLLAGLASAADVARGRLLYESRCTGCHTTSVHRVEPLKATTINAVREYVAMWNREIRGTWTPEEIDDVTLYLNERFYKYPCRDAKCIDRNASAPARAVVAIAPR